MLRGYVDGLFDSAVCGWAFNSDVPEEHLVIKIVKGHEIIGTGIADILRKDLPAVGVGDGDHAFRVEIPLYIDSLEGLSILAQSNFHGEAGLPVASAEDRVSWKVYDALSKRYDQTLGEIRDEIAVINNKCEKLDSALGPGNGLLKELPTRLAFLETRMDAAEVFFIRIDEMMRSLIEERKKRRRRFFGIF